ncbi:MAG: proton-conducting transporter membrane subunit [Kiritimatiellia bacterium]|jgi:hydrogenase-4 component F
MAYLFLFLPLSMAVLAALTPSNRLRPWLLPANGVCHFIMTCLTLAHPAWWTTGAWLALDPPGRLVLLVVSTLYLACSFYAVDFLHKLPERSNRVFCVCMLAFSGLAGLVAWSQHLGLVWVAIEGTTLVTAPLVYFNRTQRSIEASWKYLLISSVGIAIALLGTFFLAYAAVHAGLPASLNQADLAKLAPHLSRSWVRAAFVMLLVGYGTKMGLAPMHTWKPDAYGETPGVVGAILSGGVTSCAFLALMRSTRICLAAGEGVFVSRLLIAIGLFSMAAAAIFMIGQRDFKRMLAYSSVEHMGILALGLGIGAPALRGTLLHVMTNGLTKGVLFLTAGNIHRAFGSKNTKQVTGALRRVPHSAWLFMIGFFAITGAPPFGPFVSILGILDGAVATGRMAVAWGFLALLMLVFVGMGATVLKMLQGGAPDEVPCHEPRLAVVPAALLMICVLLLGLAIPSPVASLIRDAAAFLEVRP